MDIKKKKGLRVAFIVEAFPKLSETFILNQVTALLDQGHQVEIFPSRRIWEDKTHPKVEKYGLLGNTFMPPSFPKNKLAAKRKCLWLILKNAGKIETISRILSGNAPVDWRMGLFFRMLPFLGREPFDLIHCHFGTMGKIAVYAKSLGILQGKMVLTFYGYDATRHTLNPEYYENIIPNFDRFIAISSYLKEKIIKLGFPEDKISIIPLGVELGDFPSQNHKAQTPGISLLTVGRLVEKKGIYYGIMAFSKIHSRHLGLEYHIVGDGELYEGLIELIEELGLRGKIFLHGARDQEEIKEFYLRSDIFVLPSISASDGNSEGQGLVLQEAQLMELPVVSTLHNGIPEGVMDGATGFLVPERNIGALAEKVEILVNDAHLRKKMGQNGRRMVKEKFNNGLLVKRLITLYESLSAMELAPDV